MTTFTAEECNKIQHYVASCLAHNPLCPVKDAYQDAEQHVLRQRPGQEPSVVFFDAYGEAWITCDPLDWGRVFDFGPRDCAKRTYSFGTRADALREGTLIPRDPSVNNPRNLGFWDRLSQG